MAAYQAALVKDQRQRGLPAIAVPRIVLAVLLGLVPAIVLFQKRRSGSAWYLGGAILFQILFHFRYAVLDRKVYSLSSITGQNDFILYVAITGAVCMAIGWLVFCLASGSLRRGAGVAVSRTLALVLTCAYLLCLPILYHFALNGALVTWTLPEMAPAFMALLNLVALISVCASGLVLTGLSAGLAATLRPKKLS